MADFSTLKAYIASYVKQNGVGAITGEILQDVLLEMVEAIGDEALNSLASALGDEITNRQNAVAGEAETRGNADTALQNAINAINTKLSEGYVYAGIATTATNPGTPTGKVFYFALAAGTYTYFVDSGAASIILTQGISILKYSGTAWSSEQLTAIDDAPTDGSSALVKSGGVFTAIAAVLSKVADGYLYRGIATTSTNPPAPQTKVFYIATAAGTYTNFGALVVTQGINILKYDGSAWSQEQILAIDAVPTVGSHNLVESGGVWNEVFTKTEEKMYEVIAAYPKLTDIYLTAGVKKKVYIRTVGLNSQDIVLLDDSSSIATVRAQDAYNGVEVVVTASVNSYLRIRTYERRDVYAASYENRLVPEFARVDKMYAELPTIQGRLEEINSPLQLVYTVTTSATTAAVTGMKLKASVTKYIYVKTQVLASNDIVLYNYFTAGGYEALATISAADAYAGVYVKITTTGEGSLAVRSYEIGTVFTIKETIDYSVDSTFCKKDELQVVKTYNKWVYATTGVRTGCPLRKGYSYIVTIKTDTLLSQSMTIYNYFATSGNETLSTISAADAYAGKTISFVPSGDGELVVRTYQSSVLVYVTVQSMLDTSLLPFDNNWQRKSAVVYGDSITALGNGDDEECEGSYFYEAWHQYQMGHLYVRGVGGQSYRWNSYGYYSIVGTNGKYYDRFMYDSAGNKLENVVNPSTITQQEIGYIESAIGHSIELHYGAFCSWGRIKGMIPESIRESISIVILTGGTNDLDSLTSKIPSEPQWVANSQSDPDWAADNSFYNGGDYDISTFEGGMASAIMKFRLWCPNAVVVIATPFPRFTTGKQLYENANNVSSRDIADMEIQIARIMGADVIDANGRSRISGYNYNDLVSDGIHPTQTGVRLFGKTFIEEMKRL